MSQRPDYLQLETGDDANHVRDRLSFLRGQRVLIIWPEEGTALTRKLDLVLIQREAARLSIRLALVTHDAEVLENARDLGISTFETIGASERGRWKRGRSKVFTTRWQRPSDELDAEDLKAVASRLNDDEPRPSPFGPLLRIGAVLFALVVLGGLGYVVLPGATVTIQRPITTIPVETRVLADPAATLIDVENRIIPAVILRVEIEDTGTLNTTGTQNLSDTPASGSVVFINQTAEAQDIPAETTVTTSAGTPILFRTLEAVSIPGEVGAQIEVPVEALSESAGPVGNVDAGLINTIAGPLADTLTVRNLAPTFGGENRVLRAVSQEDRDRLLATVRQQLQSRAYIGMEDQKASTQTIIVETIRIVEEREDWKTWSAEVGNIADVLTLTMRARVEAVTVDETVAQQVAFARISGSLPPGQSLVPNSVSYQCCTVEGVTPEGQIIFLINGSGRAAPQIDTSAFQQNLSGLSVADAYTWLNTRLPQAGQNSANIELAPDWFGRLPTLPMRIRIQVVEAPVDAPQ